MKFLLSSLLLFLAAVAQAASSTGNRLLSIWEDVSEQKLYSKFIGDLEGKAWPAELLPTGAIDDCLLTRPLTKIYSARLQDQPCHSQAGGPEAGASGPEDV